LDGLRGLQAKGNKVKRGKFCGFGELNGLRGLQAKGNKVNRGKFCGFGELNGLRGLQAKGNKVNRGKFCGFGELDGLRGLQAKGNKVNRGKFCGFGELDGLRGIPLLTFLTIGGRGRVRDWSRCNCAVTGTAPRRVSGAQQIAEAVSKAVFFSANCHLQTSRPRPAVPYEAMAPSIT
jgi:hypothetical protein